MSYNTVSESVIDKRLQNIFQEYDSNQDGKLSKQDVIKFLEDTLREIGKNRHITS